ncbi:hypothetical protein FXO37_03233 [Capsicum annuum]|nr:hypothetical protein FXO37_03233 [Capsicum annuum]
MCLSLLPFPQNRPRVLLISKKASVGSPRIVLYAFCKKNAYGDWLDNDFEFCFNEFNALCKSEGIVRHLTVCHTPQQNGVAERMNRTIMEEVHCMLSNAGLPKYFWAKADSTACLLINHSPSVVIDKKTLQDVWSGTPASYSDLRIFGCPVYAQVDNGKLEPRSIGEESTPVPTSHSILKIQSGTIYSSPPVTPQYSIAKDNPGRDINLLRRVEDARYKARLVAKGYSQFSDIDFTDVFSPVLKHSSIRALLGIVAIHNLEFEQLDVKTAFLYGELEEDIYSPRQWYKRFDSFMTSHMFQKRSYDSCVYFKEISDGSFVYLLLYVDDMLIAPKDMREIIKLKTQLSKEFERKDLGAAKKILGMEIRRDREKRVTTQAGVLAVMSILNRGIPFNSKIPRAIWNLSLTRQPSPQLKFAARVGVSISDTPQGFVSGHSRCDASRSRLRIASHRKCHNFLPSYQILATLVSLERTWDLEAFSTLQGGIPYNSEIHRLCGICPSLYSQAPNSSLPQGLESLSLIHHRFGRNRDGVIGYVDSDFAGDHDKRRSLTGYVFTIGGCAISWKATLQTTIALLTTEAEYMAITKAFKEDN